MNGKLSLGTVFFIGGAYLIFGLPDVFLWSLAVLTDVLFLFWVTLFVFAITMGLRKQRLSWLILSIPIALCAPFVRPTGIIIPLLLCYAFIVFWYYNKFRFDRTLIIAGCGLYRLLGHQVTDRSFAAT